jgi:NADH-quinone oxidoreductase subunit M
MLAWTIYISFIGVLVLMLLPRDATRAARWVALTAAVLGCGLAFAGAIAQARQGHVGDVTTIVKVDWIPAIGATYFLAADGISLMLVVLTGLAAVAGILFSWNIEKRTKEFFAFYLALIGGVYGVFLSFDLLLLFVFYELTIIPKYFLIARWGSTRREYGAMKLALYSFVGSHLVLIGLIAAWVVARAQTGETTLNLITLSHVAFPAGFQHWVFPLVFVGFAILAGMWPFHTWAPTGHVAGGRP